MSQDATDFPEAFVAIDMDNVHHGALGFTGADAVRERFPGVLERIQELARWRIAAGFASLNQDTRSKSHPELLALLESYKVRYKIVESAPQEADKEIFFALALASHHYRRFLLISKDKGFATVAERLLEANPQAELVVVFDRETIALRNVYGRVKGVRFLELSLRGQTCSEPHRPYPGPAPGYVVVCRLCGWRLMRQAPGPGRCRNCAGGFSTPVHCDNVVPVGRVPFADGPVLEVYVRGRRRRTAVLCEQTTTFGQGQGQGNEEGHVVLDDLVVDATRIARRQFLVVRQEGDNCVLENLGGQRMLTADRRLIEREAPLPLVDGLEFYLNDPESPADQEALLKFVYRAPRRRGA